MHRVTCVVVMLACSPGPDTGDSGIDVSTPDVSLDVADGAPDELPAEASPADVSLDALTSNIVTTGLTTPIDIAQDTNHVFWIDDVTESVWQLDKSTMVATQLASAQSKPAHVAADGSYVYWTSNAGNEIRRIAVGGGTVQPLYTETTPTIIAVDGTYVYWQHHIGFDVSKGLKDGSGSKTTVCACVVEADTARLVGTELYGYYGGGGAPGKQQIWSLNTTTGKSNEIELWPTTYEIFDLGATTTSVFYFRFSITNQASIRELPTQTNPMPLSALPPTTTGMNGDDKNIYWGAADGTIRRYDTTAQSDVLVTSTSVVPGPLVVDGTYVFWADKSGFIGRALK